MSQPLTNVGATTASAKTLWYGNAGKATGTEGATATFGQTLVSMLAGEANAQDGQLTAQLAIMSGLTESSNGMAAEGEGGSLKTLLEDLLEQLEQLDEAMADDNPELLAMLQGWLQNALHYLQNMQQAAGSETAPNDSGIPALAEHAETIRFAVQDTLVQLVAASSKASANAELNSSQAKALLESLQTLLASAGITGESKAPSGKYASTLAELKGIVKDKASVHADRNVSAAEKNTAEAAKVPAISQGETAPVKASASASAVLLTGEETNAAAVESSDGEHPLQSGHIVTAGQLALRDAAAPLKAPAPPVPVEKFGDEMSRFLVSKLEIIQAGGVSEAKISLFPEHLGQVDVKITMQNGQLVAQFMTEHAFAKESLESQMAQLRSALQSQGLQVNKLEVTQNTPLSSHMYQDGRQPGSGTGQQQNGKRREVVSEEELLGVHDLNEEWNEWISSVREREGTLGSSFVARA